MKRVEQKGQENCDNLQSMRQIKIPEKDSTPLMAKKNTNINIINKLIASQSEIAALELLFRGVQGLPLSFPKDHSIQLVLETLNEYQPEDSIESKLYLQANSLYAQGMSYLSRAESQDMIPQAEHYMKFALKLLRLHNETIETLNKHKRKGEQKFVVQHVNVNGGQAAILTNFSTREGEMKNKNEGMTS